MIHKATAWFKDLSKFGKAGLVVASIVGLSVIGGASNDTKKPAAVNLNATTASSSIKAKDTVEQKTVTTTEVVAFSTSNVDNSSLAKGVTQTQVEGVNGVRTHTYNTTLTNGTETARVEVSNEITTEPVNEVIAVGTYVTPPAPSCPNGTYVNTAGNTVCSPYASPSTPAGATARCVDGTYSFSQSRSGTCSHHGGVASWL